MLSLAPLVGETIEIRQDTNESSACVELSQRGDDFIMYDTSVYYIFPIAALVSSLWRLSSTSKEPACLVDLHECI